MLFPMVRTMKRTIRVLVVDGENNDRDIISRKLKEMGQNCDLACDLETARILFSRFKYDYVILNIELPFAQGEPARVENSKEFLTLIRTRYDRYMLPVVISIPASSRNDGICSMWSYCCRKEITTVFDKASLYEQGKHSLEKAVGLMSAIVRPSSGEKLDEDDWMFNSPDFKNQNYVVWSTISKTGRERIYRLKTETIRARLLECIWKNLRDGDMISYSDLFKYGKTWTYKEFYTESRDPYHGRLRGHIDVFKKRLGLRIAYIQNAGIKVERPGD